MNAAAAAATTTSAPAALQPQPFERAPMQQNYLQEACNKVCACTNSTVFSLWEPHLRTSLESNVSMSQGLVPCPFSFLSKPGKPGLTHNGRWFLKVPPSEDLNKESSL